MVIRVGITTSFRAASDIRIPILYNNLIKHKSFEFSIWAYFHELFSLTSLQFVISKNKELDFGFYHVKDI